MKRIFLFSIFSIFFFTISFAQAPGTTCATAPTLTVNGPCAIAVVLNDNTMEPGVSSTNICASGQNLNREGWYRFQATATSATITVDANNRNATLQIFSGACGTLTEIGCANAITTNGAQIEAVTVGGLTVGTFYRVRIGNVTNNNMQVNSLCITAPVPPSNDNPCTAIALGVTSTCSYGVYTNANATASAGPPAPGCAGYSGGDVWFTVTVPASGTLDFDTQTGIMLDGGMAVYSGSCAALALIACDDNSSANGAMPMLNLTGLTPGATLWIRVWENGNNNNGTFGICVTNPFAPVTNGDCPTPVNVCSNTAFDITPSGPGSTVEYNTCSVSDPCTNPNCCNSGCHNAGELNTTWLLINIQTSGNLEFSFGSPGGFGCYDWVMWGPYTATTCANILANTLPPIACNWNATCQTFTGMANPVPAGGAAGDFEQPIPVTAGQRYIVSFSNYSGLTTTVPVNFFGTAGIGCGPLPIQLESFGCSQKGGRMSIDWVTSAEINNNYFVIERSTDGTNFEVIGTVSGSGNSNTTAKYNFNDMNPVLGVNYYRLKQIDYDGHSETFDISSCEFVLHPPSTINIYNMTGQLIQTVASSNYQNDVNNLPLSIGMYIIEVVDGNEIFYQTHFHGDGMHWYGK